MIKNWLLLVLTVTLCNTLGRAQEVSLEDYLRIAKDRSPLLREYRNAVLINRLDSQLLRVVFRPQVALISNNMYAPTFGNFGYDEAITNGGQFSTVVQASKKFIGLSNLNAQLGTLRLSGDSIRNTTLIAEQDLTRAITQQYLAAYGDQQQLRANEEISKLLSNENVVLKKLTESNVYRQTDYLTFLVTQKQQDLQMRQLRVQYLTDFATLNYLCGIVDTQAFSKTLALPKLDVALFANSLSSAFYRRYTLDSLRLQNQLQLIKLYYRPRLTVFADVGNQTTQLSTIHQTFGASAGFSINLPIYDGGRKKLSMQQIRLQEDTRQGYRQFFELQYNQQIASLMQQLSATQTLLTDIEAQIKYTKGLIEVNEKLLQTGDARIPDFVIAINNYMMAQTLLTQNRISRLQIINQVNYWNR